MYILMQQKGTRFNYYKKMIGSLSIFETEVGPGSSSSPGTSFKKKMYQKNHTVAATMAPRSQNPDVSSKNRLFAALWPGTGVAELVVAESAAIVSLGNVPLSTIAFVPLTIPTLTNDLFKLVRFPSPIIPSKKVELLASSHPHALYCSQRQVTGKVSLRLFLVRLRKLYGWL